MDKRFEKILGCLMALALLALPVLNDISNENSGGGSSGNASSLINEHPGIMRFHVIANSDSDEDQELKLAVRNYVLSKVENEITQAIVSAEKEDGSKCDQSQIMRKYINTHLPQIEAWAQEVIDLWGFDYSAAADMGIRHIPAKYYGEIFFPEGNYEALNITLGEGAGKNWWCVVFPPLCMVDSENSSYNEEFNLTEEDRLVLKFKTEELLKSLDENNLTCKYAIYETVGRFVGDSIVKTPPV